MLDDREINQLFDLLRELHGKDKPRDRRTVAIWGAVLGPWSYAQVRGAAIKRARESRYYPDPGELAAMLPRSAGGPEGQGAVGPNDPSFSLRWDAEMKARGYPCLEEWKEQGKAADDWWAEMARIQLGDRQWTALLSKGFLEKFQKDLEKLERSLSKGESER